MAKEKMQKTEKIKTNPDSKTSDKSKVVVIRISGMVKVPREVENALYRLRLRRKYACVVIDTNDKSLAGLLKQVRFHVAYGKINDETYEKLIKERGRKDAEGKLKPFFRLHPPRGGIKSKLQYANGGVLGDNKEDINKLVQRML